MGNTSEPISLFAASKNLLFHGETINTLKEHLGRTSMELSLRLLGLLSLKCGLTFGGRDHVWTGSNAAEYLGVFMLSYCRQLWPLYSNGPILQSGSCWMLVQVQGTGPRLCALMLDASGYWDPAAGRTYIQPTAASIDICGSQTTKTTKVAKSPT